MTQPDFDWIQSKLSRLMADADDLARVVDFDDDPSFGAWTALKLDFLAASVDVYTKIMSNHGFQYYFIDAMSGSGIVELSDRDEKLVGSPFVAGSIPNQPFTHLFLIEENDERAEALRSRLEYASDEVEEFNHSRDEWTVINEDANQVLPDMKSRIEEVHEGSIYGTSGYGGQHHLAFIDNETDEISFQALRDLESSLDGDLLINYQNKSIGRRRGRLQSDNHDESDWGPYMDFFDDRELARVTQDNRELFELYVGDLLPGISRGHIEYVEVKQSRDSPFHYTLIYATRKKSSGGDFMEFVPNYGGKIESLDGDIVERVLGTMTGPATRIDHWANKVKESEEGQSGLGDFPR